MTTRPTWPFARPLVTILGLVLLLTGLASCQLNQPSLPGLTGLPDQPGQPDQPSQPSQPEKPGQLNQPAQPDPSPMPVADQGDKPPPATRDALLTRHYNQILALNTITDQPKDLNELRSGYYRLQAERARCTDLSCLETLNRQLGEQICAYYPFMGDSERCRQDFAATGDEDEDQTAAIGADLAAGKYNHAGWLKIDPKLTYDAAGEDLYAWLLFHNAAFASLVDRHGVPDYLKALANPDIRLYALYDDARKIVELTPHPPREILWDLRFPATLVTSDPADVRDTAAFYQLITQADEVFSFPTAILNKILAGPDLVLISSARQERRSASLAPPTAIAPPIASNPLTASNPLAETPQPSAPSPPTPSATQGTAVAPQQDVLHVAALVRNNGDQPLKVLTLTCTSRDAKGERLHQQRHQEKRELLPGEMALIEFPFPSPTPPQTLECQT